MKKTRTVLILIAAAALALMAMTTTAQTVTLDFPTWQAEEPGVSDWWKEVIRVFEAENPGVRVRLTGITPSSQHAQQMTIRLAAGDPPDILHLPAMRAREIAAQGWLLPLDNYLRDTDIIQNWTPLQSFLNVNGQNIGLLLLGYTQVLYYNKTHLDAVGMGVPTTPDEFVRAIKATTRDTTGDGRTDVFGFAVPTQDAQTMYVEMSIWVIGAGAHWAENGEITVRTPEFRRAIGWLKELFDAGAIPLGLNIAQRNQLFFSGNSAFMMGGPWYWASVQQHAAPEVARNVGVTSQPFPNISGGASNSIHIPRGLPPQREQLAWRFIQTLARPDVQAKYGSLAKLPPARTGALTPEIINQEPLLEFFSRGVDRAVNFMPGGYEERFSEFSRVVADEINRMATNRNLTVDQVITNIETGLRRIAR